MSERPPPFQPSLLTRSVENLSTVLAIWLPSWRDRPIYAGLGDVLVPAVLLLLVQALGYRLLQPHAALNMQVLQNFAGATALAVMALAVGLALLRRSHVVWPVTIGVLWALMLGQLLSTTALLVSDASSLADWMLRRFGLVYLVPLLFLLFRLGGRGVPAFVAFVTPALLLVMPWLASLGAPDPGSEASYFNPDVEMIYAAQDSLLEAQVAGLRPGTPGKTELFAVLGAGYPFEGVFRREVEAVGALLSDRFGAGERVISLINSERDQTTHPLMNRVNLRGSLKGIADAMNAEDIALLFITTHGSPGVLSTNFDELITRDVTPTDIDEALTDAGIVNAIVILPACYSGSFAEALAAPNRLILTGADADSVSFGCNDQNEWTDWGRAFFVDALSETRDFRQAAEVAKALVAKREEEEGLPPSSPQIIEGAGIGRILDNWIADLD